MSFIQRRILKQIISTSAHILGFDIYFYTDTPVEHDYTILQSHIEKLRQCIINNHIRSRTVSTALTYVLNGVSLLCKSQESESISHFERVDKLFHSFDQKIPSFEDGVNQFLDLALMCRICILCKLFLNDYFNVYSHMYVLSLEIYEIFTKFLNFEICQLVIDDEFIPLDIPRRFGHTHMTRLSLLREISSIKSHIWDILKRHYPIKTSCGIEVNMVNTVNTAIYVPSKKDLAVSWQHDRPSVVAEDSPWVLCVACASTGVLFSGLADGRVCVWKCTGNMRYIGILDSVSSSSVSCLCVVGCVLFAGYEDGSIEAWRCSNIDDINRVHIEAPGISDGHNGAIRSLFLCSAPSSMAFCIGNGPPYSSLLLSSSIDGRVCIWNASAARLSNSAAMNKKCKVMELVTQIQNPICVNAAVAEWISTGHGDSNTGPLGHRDGRTRGRYWLRVFVACGTGTWDRVIRVFSSLHREGDHDITCGQTGTLRGHEDHVHNLLLLNDKERLLSSSADRSVRVWCTRTLTQLLSFTPDSIISSWFYHYGKVYSGSSENKIVSIWDPEHMECVGTIEKVYTEQRHTESITCFTAYRGCLYTGSVDGTVRENFL